MTALSEPRLTSQDGASPAAGGGLRRAVVEQLPLLSLVAAYTLAVYWAESLAGLAHPLRNVGFGNFYFLFAVSVACYGIGALAVARS